MANGPHEATLKSQALHDRVLINVEYRVATFAYTERKKRAKGDRRNTEIEALIKSAFESTILGHLYSRSQVFSLSLSVSLFFDLSFLFLFLSVSLYLFHLSPLNPFSLPLLRAHTHPSNFH